MTNEPSDQDIEEYLKKINRKESDPIYDPPNAVKRHDKDTFWMGVIFGAILNLILLFIIPLSFSILGGIVGGYMAGSARKGIFAGFVAGLFSGIVIVLLFFMGTGVTFFLFMKTIEMYTGIGPSIIISIIAIVFGFLYSILGAFGGGIGGTLAHYTQ